MLRALKAWGFGLSFDKTVNETECMMEINGREYLVIWRDSFVNLDVPDGHPDRVKKDFGVDNLRELILLVKHSHFSRFVFGITDTRFYMGKRIPITNRRCDDFVWDTEGLLFEARCETAEGCRDFFRAFLEGLRSKDVPPNEKPWTFCIQRFDTHKSLPLSLYLMVS